MPDRKFNRKRSDDNNEGSPAWMTTFGDMMTLLLVFFVLLYSFSVMDLEKFRGFISSLKNQLGVLDGGKTLTDENLQARGSEGERFNPAQQNFSKIMGEMQEYIAREGLQDKVKLEITQRGLVVTLTGEVLYDIGETRIKSPGREVLDKLFGMIKDIPNNVKVEGHTDNWPINNDKFPSNWELSTTRATNVIRYFIDNYQINPSRLSAAGYSEYRPLYPNNSAKNRARNRRIEVVILSSINDNITGTDERVITTDGGGRK